MDQAHLLSLLLNETDDQSSSDEFEFVEDAMFLHDADVYATDIMSNAMDNNSGEPINKTVQDVDIDNDNPFPKGSEAEFIRNFRIRQSLFDELCIEFANTEAYSKLREDKRMSPEKHLQLFLWFAGREVPFRLLRDRFNISLSTITVALVRVMEFISNLSPKVIKWPSEDEIQKSSEYFQYLDIPNVLGIIDGTYVQIESPTQVKSIKNSYTNSRGQLSLQLQGVVNHDKKFINIFVGYPGSATNSYVFKRSEIYCKIHEKCGVYVLLADSAYPLMENVLTPYPDNGRLTENQANFNRKLAEGHTVIEEAFANLKRRFRQLYHCKLRGIKKVNHFIRACCVLHNLSHDEDLDFLEPALVDENEERDLFSETQECCSKLARIKRDEISLFMDPY